MNEFLGAADDIISGQADDRPFFIYSSRLIDRNIDNIKSMLRKTTLAKADSKYYFSVKANPNKDLVRYLITKFDGVDVSSLREFKHAEAIGLKGGQITISGPAKTNSFLEQAVSYGAKVIHIDNREEYESLKACSQNNTLFSLRVNVDDKSGKLGMSISDAEELLIKAEMDIAGFHFYLGRESYSDKKIIHALDLIAPLADKYFKTKMLRLFVGPAFPSHLNESLVSAIKHPLLERDNLEVHFEMGRVVLETAGVYGAKVLTVKESLNGKKEIIINGGIQHLSSTLMALKKKEDVKVLRSNQHKPPFCEVNIYGSLCLGNDLIFISDEIPADIKRGDWLLFYPCGAYNISASASEFIMQDQAREYFIEQSVLKEISR